MTDTRQSRKRQRSPLQRELHLEAWGAKGAVQGTIDGRKVLVSRGIPGEEVRATLDRRRASWRGIADTVISASPHRIAPPCPYYLERCGGCQWQHLEYEAQLQAKRQLADRELERAGVGARVRQIVAMDDPWRYRHTAAVAIGWEAGFRPLGRRGIVEIHDCLISHPLIGRLADELNRLLRAGKLPNYHGKVWMDCTVVGMAAAPTLQVVIQGIAGLTLESHPELPEVAEVVATIGCVSSVAFRHHSGAVVPLVGRLLAEMEIAGGTMYVPAGAFVQTNPVMVAQVLDRMRQNLEAYPAEHAADIYGGIGTFGLPLAAYVRTMTLIELDPQAVEAAERTAASWGLRNVQFVAQHAERALPGLEALDVAIVDPPRSGLGPAVVEALQRHAPSRIFYVSCAPPSLAHDLAGLEAGGYRVRSLDLFDFYPQTYHVESLAVLER